MKTNLISGFRIVFGGFAILGFVQTTIAQFVKLTAEIQTLDWTSGPKERSYAMRSVVGTNAWMLSGNTMVNAAQTFWFTGSNIVERTLVTDVPSETSVESLGTPGLIRAKNPPVGSTFMRTYESSDGNPGRPVRISDLLTTPISRVAWLAFCSGPCLARGDSKLYPPNDLWKEYLDSSGFTWKISRFQDALGLPERVIFYASETQPLFEYRVTLSTNVAEWRFPLEFYLVQYNPTGTKGWMLEFIAKGRVEEIGAVPSMTALATDHH